MLPLILALALIGSSDPEAQDGYNPDGGFYLFTHSEAAWETHHPDFIAAMKVPSSDGIVYEQSTYRGMGNGDVEQWRPLVAGQFPPEQVENALCVIRSESGGNPSARNPRSTASGLFQIMASIWAPHFGLTYDDLYSPEINTYVAARIYEKSGWRPWSLRTRRICGL